MFTDACFAPADGSEPIPVTGFRHDLHWTGDDGQPVDYGRDGEDVRGLAGRVEYELENGKRVAIHGEGVWSVPYGRLGGGQHQMSVRTDDGREGTAVYELTGALPHRSRPPPRADTPPPGCSRNAVGSASVGDTTTIFNIAAMTVQASDPGEFQEVMAERNQWVTFTKKGTGRPGTRWVNREVGG